MVFKIQFPPVQWIPQGYWVIYDRPYECFGGYAGYFKVLQSCGLWDFKNDCVLEDHHQTCGGYCTRECKFAE